MAIDLVAITGANGTIGYYSVLHALRTGYRVRCIVRRQEAIAQIKKGPSLQSFLDKIEYAIVPDNSVPGAYDEALSGVQYVIHIAGVWPMPHYHPDDDIWYPFVRSMENVLSASKKSGTVRRTVITQAGAALVSPDDGDTLGTRMDRILDEHVEVHAGAASFRPPLASPHHAYCGAKAYCMKFLESVRKDPDTPFSIAQVIPGTVMGPSELVTTAAEAYAQMDRMSRALLFNEPKPRYAFGFVHVEDCARVHVEALSSSNVLDADIPSCFIAAATSPAGKRAQDNWKEVGDFIAKNYPEEIANGLFTIGRDNLPINIPFRVDSSQTEKLLLSGEKIRGLRECVSEVAEWYVTLHQSKKAAGVVEVS